MIRDRHAAGSRPARPPGESVMAGSGYYSRHSEAQHAAAAPGMALLERAARQVPVLGERPVLIGDFGCAGGHNELEPMRVAIAAVRDRASTVPIMVVHTDLPSNDFTSLFQAVEQSRASYLTGQSNVYAYAAGRSLYGPIFPDAALTLGWTAITVHWLSAMPVVVPDQIFANLTDGPARDALKAQSRRDWEVFLRERLRELRPGGQLRSMTADGRLRRSEYESMFYPTWNRTLQEFRAPFEAGPLAGALILEEWTEHAFSDGATYPQFERDGDAAAFAEAYVPFVKAVTAPAFFRWIEPDRPDGERAAIGDAFYDGLKRRIAADPAKATCHWRAVSLRIRKPA